MSDNNSGQFYKGLFFGAIVGAVAGVLLAPEEGKKTQAKLKKKLEAAKKEYAPMLEGLSKKAEEFNKDLAPAATVVKQKVEEAKKVVEKKVGSVSSRRRSPRFFKGV